MLIQNSARLVKAIFLVFLRSRPDSPKTSKGLVSRSDATAKEAVVGTISVLLPPKSGAAGSARYQIMSSFQLRMQETGYNFLVPSIPFYSYAPALESHCFMYVGHHPGRLRSIVLDNRTYTPLQTCGHTTADVQVFFFFFFFGHVSSRPGQQPFASLLRKKKKKKKTNPVDPLLVHHSTRIDGLIDFLDCDLRMPESNCPWAPRSTVGCVPASQLHGCSQVRCEGSISSLQGGKKKKKRSCSSFPMAPIQKLPNRTEMQCCMPSLRLAPHSPVNSKYCRKYTCITYHHSPSLWKQTSKTTPPKFHSRIAGQPANHIPALGHLSETRSRVE
ncbi:hypothetical protein FN846DRAFT_63109 [Sphaerosporella brunnea]|uniref:Uncharacterized protein n=1 Tax=Sphaerosporella brunnea TaxID=1250544 RepID=A0A5J5ETI9_9PEZI|nr:hypothetical protein FN846DRAFT_63109 [Sphaerosporella brunnea]